MRDQEVWYQGAVMAMVVVATKLFVFNWQNPELTQFQVLQEAARWPWRAWGAPVIALVVYVATALAVKAKRTAR